MKVGELISELRKMPRDASVLAQGCGYDCDTVEVNQVELFEQTESRRTTINGDRVEGWEKITVTVTLHGDPV